MEYIYLFFFWTAVRRAILYDIKYSVVNENKISVVEMRMLFWMCDKIRHDKIRNDTKSECQGSIYSIKEDGNRLRWFGHVERKYIDLYQGEQIRLKGIKQIEVEEDIEKLFKKLFKKIIRLTIWIKT